MAACWAVLVEVRHGQFAEARGQLMGERLQSCRAACETLLSMRVRLWEGRGMI